MLVASGSATGCIALLLMSLRAGLEPVAIATCAPKVSDGVTGMFAVAITPVRCSRPKPVSDGSTRLRMNASMTSGEAPSAETRITLGDGSGWATGLVVSNAAARPSSGNRTARDRRARMITPWPECTDACNGSLGVFLARDSGLGTWGSRSLARVPGSKSQVLSSRF